MARKNEPSSERVELAQAGMDKDVIELNSRLSGRGGKAEMDADLRLLEALLFAAAEPIDIETLRSRMPEGSDLGVLIARLARDYEGRGINLVRISGRWRFQSASDLAPHLTELKEARRKLSQAALETLAIIAYHQPVTRPEIEDVRGVAVSAGTLDVLMELGWIRLRGRRRSPGRPVTYGTTDQFLAHFNLDEIADLPGKADLKAAGLLDSRLPKDFEVPSPMMPLDLTGEEEPLEPDEQDPEFVMDFMNNDEEIEQ